MSALDMLAAGIAEIDWDAEAKRTREFANTLASGKHLGLANVMNKWADEYEALAAKYERGAL